MCHGTVPPRRPSGTAETRNESDQYSDEIKRVATSTFTRSPQRTPRGHNSADDDEDDTAAPDGDETKAKQRRVATGGSRCNSEKRRRAWRATRGRLVGGEQTTAGRRRDSDGVERATETVACIAAHGAAYNRCDRHKGPNSVVRSTHHVRGRVQRKEYNPNESKNNVRNASESDTRPRRGGGGANTSSAHSKGNFILSVPTRHRDPQTHKGASANE